MCNPTRDFPAYKHTVWKNGYLWLRERNIPLLNPLSRMKFPISIGRTSLFQILEVLGGIFHSYSSSNRTFCEQTVETLIRRRVLRRLIWV